MSGQPEDAIRAIMAADADWLAAIGPRFYPHRAPQGAAFPYAVHRQSYAEPWHHLTAQCDKGDTFFEVEIWTNTYEQARQLMERVRVVLGGYRGNVNISTNPAISLFISSIWIEDYGILGPEPKDGSDLPQWGASLSIRVAADLTVA